MLDDITTAIKAQLYERATSPLMGSFLISWSVINYKFLLILFSSLPVLEKISHIDNLIFPRTQDYFIHGLIWPMAAALFLIFIYPFPAKYIYRHSKKTLRALKDIQHSIDEDSPISHEEARKLRRTLRLAETESDNLSKERQLEIELLKSEISEAQIILIQAQSDLELSKDKENLFTASIKNLKKELKTVQDALSESFVRSRSIITADGFTEAEKITTDQNHDSLSRYIIEKNIFSGKPFKVSFYLGQILIRANEITTVWGSYKKDTLHEDILKIHEKLDRYKNENEQPLT